MAVEHKYVRKDYNLSYNILYFITEILTCEKRLQILFSVGWYSCTLHRK